MARRCFKIFSKSAKIFGRGIGDRLSPAFRQRKIVLALRLGKPVWKGE
jgi:hypothetical protein